jgi:hypothetical protein
MSSLYVHSRGTVQAIVAFLLKGKVAIVPRKSKCLSTWGMASFVLRKSKYLSTWGMASPLANYNLLTNFELH